MGAFFGFGVSVLGCLRLLSISMLFVEGPFHGYLDSNCFLLLLGQI
jgi:hypothetical protein